MLAVAIHNDDGITAGPFEAGAKGEFLAEVPAETETMEVGKCPGLLGNDFPGIIRRTVIDNDQLGTAAGPGKFDRYSGKKSAEVSRFLIKRHNYRNKRRTFNLHGAAFFPVT
jgi:hypothetical protein